MPVSLAIGGLRLLLVVFYRQSIDTYPSAGGPMWSAATTSAIKVASVAGAALLVDYVLTVAISVSRGVQAMSL